MKKILLSAAITAFGFGAFAQIPTNGLVGKWTFNNGNANDEIAHNHGTVSGATLTTDRFGNTNHAYSFDGSSYIDFGVSEDFYFPTSSFSISVWIKMDTMLFGTILAKRGSANGYSQYALYVGDIYTMEPSQSIASYVRSENSYNRACFSQFNYDGQWNHIVLNHDYNGRTELYVNGNLSQYSENSYHQNPISNSESPLVLGYRSQENDKFFNGDMDDVLMYNRTLTEQEIDEIYNAADPNLPASIFESKDEDFKLYPNPAQGILNIQSDKTQWIKITNSIGKTIATHQMYIGQNTIDTSSFITGIYFITSSDGKSIKWIKE